MFIAAATDTSIGGVLWKFMGTTTFNSFVLGVGVLVAWRQLAAARKAIKEQSVDAERSLQQAQDSLKAQLAASQQSLDAHMTALQRQMEQDAEKSRFELQENRQIAKRRETARMMLASRGDEQLQQGWRTLRRYFEEDGLNIRVLATKPAISDTKHDAILADRAAVMYLLNHFESIAICVDRDIYCEDMVRDGWQTMMYQTFERARNLISKLRDEQANGRVLIKFEQLVERWRNEGAAK